MNPMNRLLSSFLGMLDKIRIRRANPTPGDRSQKAKKSRPAERKITERASARNGGRWQTQQPDQPPADQALEILNRPDRTGAGREGALTRLPDSTLLPQGA